MTLIKGALRIAGLDSRFDVHNEDEQTLMKRLSGAILAKFKRIPILADETAADRRLAN